MTTTPHRRTRAGVATPALDALRAGDPVLLTNDHAGRSAVLEDTVLVAAAGLVTTAAVAGIVRHGTGLLQVALPTADCRRLRLAPMTWDRAGPNGRQRVAVDAAVGISTGISAADRATTAHLLGDPRTRPSDLVRPGRVIPVEVGDGDTDPVALGVELCRAAGTTAAALVSAVVSTADPTRTISAGELEAFARRSGIPLVTTTQVLQTSGTGRGYSAAG